MSVTYDWNGENIEFSNWAPDAVGKYEYTTRDLKYNFDFELRKVGSEIRIYILQQPSYGSRDTGGHPTHRLTDADGKYICIKGDLTPNNVPDALSWLVYWAEETGKYIDTGGGFS